MINRLAYISVTVVHALLVAWLTRLLIRRPSLGLSFVLLITLGLVYDNGIISAGRAIGEGSLLESLNWPRYVIHAFATPLLIIYAFESAARAKLRWAQHGWVRLLFWGITALLIVYGFVVELPSALVPSDEGGVLRYEPAGGGVLPVPAFVTMAVLIGVGVAQWRSRGWPGLALAAAISVVGFGAAPALSIEVLGQVAEVVLILGIALTEGWLQKEPTPAAGPRATES